MQPVDIVTFSKPQPPIRLVQSEHSPRALSLAEVQALATDIACANYSVLKDHQADH
jgi:hypothetical protein